MAVGNYMEAVLDKLVDDYASAERLEDMTNECRESTDESDIEDSLMKLAAMWNQLKQNREREQGFREEEARRKKINIDAALCQQIAYVKSRLPDALLEFDSDAAATSLMVQYRDEKVRLGFMKGRNILEANFPFTHTLPGFRTEDLSEWRVSGSPSQSTLIREFRTVIAVMAEKE